MNDWNTNKLIRVTESSVLNTNGFNATWNNGVEASSNLTKVGAGTLRINGFSPSMSTQFWDLGTGTQTGGRMEVDGHARMTIEVNDGVLAARGTFHGVRAFTDKATLQPGDIGGPGVGTIDAAGLIISLGSVDRFRPRRQQRFAQIAHDAEQGEWRRRSGQRRVPRRSEHGPGHLHADRVLRESVRIAHVRSPATSRSRATSPASTAFFGINTLPNGWQAVQFTVTSVPEPTAALAAAGLVAIVARRGRRRKA